MTKPISVFCVALALLGLLQTCSAVQLRRDYYVLPSSEAIQQSRELRDIKAALVKIAEAPGSSDPEETRGRINKLFDETDDYFEKDVFGELISLTDDTDICSASLVKYIVDIIGILESCQDGSLDRLHRYLDHFGLRRFRRCAAGFELDFILKTFRVHEDQAALDEFFIVALGLDEHLSTAQLVRVLSGIDMASLGALKNKRKLLKFAEEHSTMPRYGFSKANFILNFFLKVCPKVVVPFEKSLNVVNLANDLHGYKVEDSALEKLNEYKRICNGFMDPQRRPITMMNIKRLVD